ncbi:MAG TPA: primosomal protein DnaI [Bacillales bacterium]|nr:primosomal protein DnaI [Bacillales bacterium]
MESIHESLQRMAGNSDFTERYEKLKKKVTNHGGVREFLTAHPELTENAVDRGMAKFYEFARQSVNCDHCPGLEACPNVMKGYQPHLFVNRGQVEIRYERCPLKQKADEAQRQKSMFQSLYEPKEVLEASMDKLDLSQGGRLKAIQAAKTFVQHYEAGRTSKGLYVYGGFGVGKTYIMGAIANSLAKHKDVQSLMVYTPDFFRDLKMSIQNQTVNEKLDYIKKVPVLILDDIGAETISPWIRDDVLGTVLQYRMMEKLPTLYTSNWDYDELERHLAYSQKHDAVEDMKAKRIMERIRHLTTEVKAEGTNRRTLD